VIACLVLSTNFIKRKTSKVRQQKKIRMKYRNQRWMTHVIDIFSAGVPTHKSLFSFNNLKTLEGTRAL
jgi:hypothetical protein